METPPILFIIFRRPETTKVVWEVIRQARPRQLFIAADGPRSGRADEAEACRQTRSLVTDVDWPCELKTLFQEKNLGTIDGPVSAISWFFSEVEEGIILEDDCVPHLDFFRYCAELLPKYRGDPRVFHIGGNNFQPQNRKTKSSYYFSRYNHIWGWATWRRAWELYRPQFEELEDFLAEARRTKFWDSDRERRYWSKMFRRCRSGRIIAWDYPWTYSMWAYGAFAVTPESNLVVNIGFGAGADHQFEAKDEHGQRPSEALSEIIPNSWVLRDVRADRYTFRRKFWGTPLDRLRLRFGQLGRLLGWMAR